MIDKHPMVEAIHNALIVHLFVYIQNARAQGLFLEFGVATGGTIKIIAENVVPPGRTVFGFDSFEGLPEDWSGGINEDGKHGIKKGTFACDMPLPGDLPPNVTLIKGWFEDTLPKFVDLFKEQKVSFMHIDSDLGSSARTIFDNFGHMLQEGTIIVFDEIMGYPGWEDGEFKAFNEFLELWDYDYDCIGIHAGNLDDLEHAPEVKAGFRLKKKQPNTMIVTKHLPDGNEVSYTMDMDTNTNMIAFREGNRKKSRDAVKEIG